MSDIRIRYCQRCNKQQALTSFDSANPCRGCGGVYFDDKPKHFPHTASTDCFELTERDITFLRVQGIKPTRFS